MQTLVVAGASLGLSGCGGESRRTLEGAGDNGGGGGTTGSGGGTAIGGRAGASATVYTGDIEGCPSAQRVCTCSYEPPAALWSCTYRHPFGYYGDSTTSLKLTSMDCRCDATRPAAPDACAYTEQFTCLEYTPEHEACVCEPTAPQSEDDCDGHRIFQCAAQDPLIGCACITPIR